MELANGLLGWLFWAVWGCEWGSAGAVSFEPKGRTDPTPCVGHVGENCTIACRYGGAILPRNSCWWLFLGKDEQNHTLWQRVLCANATTTQSTGRLTARFTVFENSTATASLTVKNLTLADHTSYYCFGGPVIARVNLTVQPLPALKTQNTTEDTIVPTNTAVAINTVVATSPKTTPIATPPMATEPVTIAVKTPTPAATKATTVAPTTIGTTVETTETESWFLDTARDFEFPEIEVEFRRPASTFPSSKPTFHGVLAASMSVAGPVATVVFLVIVGCVCGRRPLRKPLLGQMASWTLAPPSSPRRLSP